MTDKRILFSSIILVISFLALFTKFQTIPVLFRSPLPIGFGGNAIASADVQLPFMIVFLFPLFAPSSGFIVSRIGSIKPTIIGSVVSTIAFISLLVFHSTEFSIAINLAIIAAGISLMRVGVYEIVLKSK